MYIFNGKDLFACDVFNCIILYIACKYLYIYWTELNGIEIKNALNYTDFLEIKSPS